MTHVLCVALYILPGLIVLQAEEAYWRSQGEGEKSRAAAKREEEERKRQEALARKAGPAVP